MSQRANSIIGIDLSNSTTIVARFNENGEPEPLPNRSGEKITPSVVQILNNGDVIVGTEAKKFLGSGTPNVFAEFKREIGSDKTWNVNGRTITPTDLSALLLKQVVEECTEQFGKPTAIVISWPANFREEQRQATMEAAKKAGLNVQYFISEPNATALYYSLDTKLSGHYLIYDFGGGTFGVTIIKADGSDIELVWSEGIQQLGGKDFDAELVKIIAAKFKAKTGGEFDYRDCNFQKREIEEAKHALSVRDKISFRLLSNNHGLVTMEITREEFEAAISHLVTQAEIACETALMNGKVAKSDIKEVFMSGGTSRALAIQRSVERMFGKKPIIRNPEHAVALGACVYAAQKTNPKVLTPMQRETMGQTKVSDVSPHFLGILAREPTGELINQVMIRKGIPVPCHETIRLWPINHNITSVRLSLTQSAIEEPNVDFVSVLTDIQIKVPAISNPVLRVKIGYDTNGTATLNTKWESDSDSALDFMIKAPKPRPPASRSHAAERRLLLPGSSD